MRINGLVAALALSMLVAGARGAEPSILPVSCTEAPRYDDRLYVAGILGSAAATLTIPDAPSASDSIFSVGGALGYSLDLDNGALRVEIEGRARDPVSELASDSGIGVSHPSATGGWSTTVNAWRDFDVTDRVTCYLGAGIGGGGYQFGINKFYPVPDETTSGLDTVSGFAWQAGGGLAWAITDGLTLDLGYRFFELAGGGINAQVTQGGIPVGTDRISSAFSSSELFFAFRIYEPLRGWW